MVEDQAVPDDQHLNTSPRLFAGFTFIGQFIDHDITFHRSPGGAQQQADPTHASIRTPRYDLDSVYGGGPTVNPAIYDPDDPARLRLELNGQWHPRPAARSRTQRPDRRRRNDET